MAYIANINYELRTTEVMGFKLPFKTFDGIDYKFWTFLPDNIEEHLADLKEVEIREDDVLICTYPRSGTNWTNEIVRMLLENSAEYTDYLMEFIDMVPKAKLAEMKSPRLLMTHSPLRLMPRQLAEKGRVICVFRNPKDVAVSFHHFMRSINFAEYDGNIGDFLKLFYNGDLPGGSWFDHVKEWERDIAEKKVKSILTLYYEDMKKDLLGHVEKIAEFLGLPQNSELIDNITTQCSFSNLSVEKNKRIPSVIYNYSKDKSNYLYRKGEVGGWKNWLTVAQNEEFDLFYQSNMKDSKLQFTYTDS